MMLALGLAFTWSLVATRDRTRRGEGARAAHAAGRTQDPDEQSGAQLAAWDFLKPALCLLPIGPRLVLSVFFFCLLCVPAVHRGPSAATGAVPPPFASGS